MTTTTSSLLFCHHGNVVYPLLRVSPSFGEGIRPHVDGVVSAAYQSYLEDEERQLAVRVDWGTEKEAAAMMRRAVTVVQSHGNGHDENDDDDDKKNRTAVTLRLELTIHGLGRRPGYHLVAQTNATTTIATAATSSLSTTTPTNDDEQQQQDKELAAASLPPLQLSWSAKTSVVRQQQEEEQHQQPHDDNTMTPAPIYYPEYLAQLQVWCVVEEPESMHKGNNDSSKTTLLLRRCRHVLPPPEPQFHYRLSEILSAPSLRTNKKCWNSKVDITRDDSDATMTTTTTTTTHRSRASRRRRGFGIELETVQLPPDPEATECFTSAQEYRKAIQEAQHRYEQQQQQHQQQPAVDSTRQLDRINNNVQQLERINNTGGKNDNKNINSAPTTNHVWERLRLWNVETDPEVENAAPSSRMELWDQIIASTDNNNQTSSGSPGAQKKEHGIPHDVKALVLGGKPSMQDYFWTTTTTTTTAINDESSDNGNKSSVGQEEYRMPPGWEHVNQASPEYKSPPPPMELYHEFPPPSCGYDEANREIDLLLNHVLKCGVESVATADASTEQLSQDQGEQQQPQETTAALSKSILCPTVSMIGQSASSIHIHVNICNPQAWPRQQDKVDDLAATRALLSVLINWVRFDIVIANSFCQPWMKRDRSFAPMYALGPEFLFQETAWQQGTTGLSSSDSENNGSADRELFSFSRFFQHAFETYRKGTKETDNDAKSSSSTTSSDSFGEQKKDEYYDGIYPTKSLFEQVFDPAVIDQTLYRRNALNLCSLKKYGTVEIRRMHATLDADFVNAWTWFCVGFVESFSAMDQQRLAVERYFDAHMDWKTALEQLYQAQNQATLEDLMQLMLEGKEGAMVPPNTFSVLMDRVGAK